MLPLRGTTLGDFDFSARVLAEDERKFYGIFISHANADNDAYLYPLRDAMLKANIHPLCDRDFLVGGDDFQLKIESHLDCYAAVVILTPNALDSHWVNYEMGILAARDIPLFLWDPTGLMRGKGDLNMTAYTHLGRFKPVYETMESLLQALENVSPYAEMFSEETAFINSTTFRDRMKEHGETVIAEIESELFDLHYDAFNGCKFGILIPNFGMFYEDHGDGEHCYARRSVPLENGLCPQSGCRCALAHPSTLGEDNKECVALNHLSHTGRLLRAGEADPRGKKVSIGTLRFHMPLHKKFGTEFKFIIDVPPNGDYDTLMELLEAIGLNPTSSCSHLGNRIYLSLPERRTQGLFQLDHIFHNNFLCPHAARAHN